MRNEGLTEPQLSEIDRIEQHFLVGREQEVRLFLNRLHSDSVSGGIINLYGTGGVGKSYLLNEYRRLSICNRKRYLLFDCRVIPRNPLDFCLQLLHAFDYSTLPDNQIETIEQLTEICVHKIRNCTADEKPVLALDTFEAISGDTERWLREKFLPHLLPDTLVIISGRFPLQGAWLASPGWRQFIFRIPLAELDYTAVCQYVERSGITKESSLQHIWAKTKGHPLTLSLLVSTMLVGAAPSTKNTEENDVFPHVVAAWLQEVPDPDMREMVEAAAVLKQFNHELMNFVLEKSVTSEQFRKLTAYSFVQRVERGWLLHDLLRDSIGFELRRSNPDYHNRLWMRCVSYYSEKIKRSAKKGTAAWENAEILYYLGNHFIQFMLYRQTISYSMEQLNPANWAEAEQYLEQRRLTAKDNSVVYTNRETGNQVTYTLTAKESLNILNQIRLKELYELDPSCVILIRDEKGKINGLMESIPINERTIPYLRSRPISSSYFNQITETERNELSVPGHTKAGYFVKILDTYDIFDPSMMQASVSTFIHFNLTAGYVVCAPLANPITDAFSTSLGMEKTNIVHYDYDGETPTPYHVMDMRGNKILDYLDKMLSSFGLSETTIDGNAKLRNQLSRREREVVDLLMNGRTNKEIAGELFLSEATIKKHLSNIFEKLGIKSRTQLISLFKGEFFA